MESTQWRKGQSPGSANRGGGKICRRCGWVYPNAHPGKKHRQAHQKRCRATASMPADDAGNAAARVVDVSVGPCELLAEENHGGKCGEEVMGVSVPEGEEGEDVRDMSPSGGDGEEMVKNTILEIAFVENSHKYALDHGDMVQSPNEEPIETHAESSICLQSHSVSSGAHVVYASEDSNFVFYSTSTDGSLLAAPEEMDCATAQSILDTPIRVTPYDFSLTVDRASPVNVQVANLVREVTANAVESKLYNSQDMKSDVAKDVSEARLSCKDGAFTSETNTNGLFDVSVHSSGDIHQAEKPVNSLLIMNKFEDSHTLPLASTSCLVEVSDVNPDSLEDHGSSCSDGLCSLKNNACEFFNISAHFSGCDNQNSNASLDGSEPEDHHSSAVVSKAVLVVLEPGYLEAFAEEPDLTKPCGNAEVGKNIDKNVNDSPSIISADEEFSFHRETFDGNKTNEINKDHNYKNVNSRIQLTNELEHEVALAIVNFQGPKEEMDQLQRDNRVTSVELPVDQARDINRTSDSCETDCSAIEKEADKLESLSKGLDAYEYSGANLTNADSGMHRFNVSSVINIESQIDRQAKTPIDNNFMNKEKIHEMGQEGSYSMDPRSCSQSISYPFIPMPPHGDESEKTDLLNRNGAISLKQHYISSSEIFEQSDAGNQTIDHSDRKAETFVLQAIAERSVAGDGISSSYSHSVSDCNSDQQRTQEILEERFEQPSSCDKTIDHPDGKALITVFEATSESAIHDQHSYGLDVHIGGTNNVETILLSQLKQDVHDIAKIELLNSDKNNPDSLFVANTDVHIASGGKENTCCSMNKEESNARQCSEVCLFPEGGESITTEPEKMSTIIHSLAGKPSLDPHPKINHHIEVTSNNFYQPSKEENVHIECMEQTQSSGGKLDDTVEPMEEADSSNKKTLDSVKENIETCSIRALRSLMPEGAIPSMGYVIEAESNLDVAASPPTNSLTAKELLSDLTAVDAFQGNVDIFDMLEISLTTLVESGRRSVTMENATVEILKQEFAKRNSIDENTDNLLDLNFGQPQAILKNLLAEAHVERKQKFASGRDDTAVLSSKRISWHTENDEHALEPATLKTVSERSNEFLGNRAYHKEWNSPARLPVTKHNKKKVKRRQTWIPFICCSSIH
ncbi:uncharacterized protein LOC121967822 [Zingiber officinale]|uniref:uncharacterized protein LOC121967822 n=1 Tax=Zingiber officinale TaxID=94328 RepID=UPI001C4C082A|nr:uncharacterized protein LOC121967822 [Zingiber officinale]